jgi:RecJ-like exonuclease
VNTGSPGEVVDFLASVLSAEVKHRLEHISALAVARERSLDDARRYVEASLAFQVYAHRIYEEMRAPAHGHRAERDHHG